MTRAFLFILATIFTLSLHAQRYGFRQYTVQQGLTHSQVRAIKEDGQGYLWIGTLGGLSRFDGRSFTDFGPSKSFTFDQVESLCVLSDGRLATGSTGAFSILNEDSNLVYLLKREYAKTAIRKIVQDSSDSLWLATQSGLFRSSLTGDIRPAFSEVLAGQDIRDLLIAQDQLLVLTENSLLNFSEGSADTLLHREESDFYQMLSGDSDIWLASNGFGLWRLSSKAKINYTTQEGLISNRILNLAKGKNGEIYCGSRLGFSMIKGDGKISSFDQSNGLPYAEIRAMMVDHQGQLWLGTDGGGVIRFLGSEFTHFTVSEGLPSNLIMTISQDLSGDVWVGTYDNGIYNLNNSKERLGLNQELADSKVWTSLCDKVGRLWFGTSGGLSIVEGDKVINLGVKDGLPGSKVLSLYEDGQGQIYAGCSSGLIRFDKDLNSFTYPDFPSGKVRSILTDPKGQMWFGTSKGLVKFDGTSYQKYGVESGLKSTSISSLCSDDNGRLWIATKKGLHYLENDSIRQLRLGDSYSSNFVNFLFYRSGSLLVGSNNGIYVLNTSQLEEELRHFNLDDGLVSLETNMNAVLEDNNGNLWFGTVGGLMFHEGRLSMSSDEAYPPLLHFTDLRLNLNPTNWSELGMEGKDSSGLPQNLSLSYQKNNLTFFYNGIHHKYPESVRYRYRLIQFDDDWQPLTKTAFATYTNLPGNEYTFEVKSISKEGVWSKPIRYSFQIKPPFWSTWWFILICLFLASGSIYLFFRRRRARMVEEMERERIEMQSKMLVLEQQSLNSSMNRHFIFNALNSIQYYINRKDRLSANKYLSSFAKLIRKNLDSSQTTFVYLSEELDRLRLYLDLETMRFKDKFSYEIEVEKEVSIEELKVPSMLLQPFLENSIWHGLLPKEEKGLVLLSIASDQNGQIIFTITDNGIGIDSSKASKILDENHISKGMDISQGRLELITRITGSKAYMEGPYEIQDDEGSVTGTEVRLFLPKDWALED